MYVHDDESRGNCPARTAISAEVDDDDDDDASGDDEEVSDVRSEM